MAIIYVEKKIPHFQSEYSFKIRVIWKQPNVTSHSVQQSLAKVHLVTRPWRHNPHGTLHHLHPVVGFDAHQPREVTRHWNAAAASHRLLEPPQRHAVIGGATASGELADQAVLEASTRVAVKKADFGAEKTRAGLRAREAEVQARL